MDNDRTLGEVFAELYENLRTSLGDHLDKPADQEAMRYKITFSELLDSDGSSWDGTDCSGG